MENYDDDITGVMMILRPQKNCLAFVSLVKSKPKFGIA